MLAGCATPQTDRLLESATAFPRPVELTAVPFFPQEAYQCGPAALATVLNGSGLNVTPEELTPQVYLPERQGSLQFELLAAARRHGRVPYVLRPQLEAITTEIASGNPVLVLQNLGISAVPFWHYAVVVGFDLARAEVVLRSGREHRHVTSLRTFEHTWRRGDYWAVVVLPPGELPQTAEELPYLQSVLALEKLKRWQDTATAYGNALTRWPKSLGAHMGLGNSRYALATCAPPRRRFARRRARIRTPRSRSTTWRRRWPIRNAGARPSKWRGRPWTSVVITPMSFVRRLRASRHERKINATRDRYRARRAATAPRRAGIRRVRRAPWPHPPRRCPRLPARYPTYVPCLR